MLQLGGASLRMGSNSALGVPGSLSLVSPPCIGKINSFFFFEGVGLYQVACRILVPLPGIETSSLALDVWSLKHWISREVKLNLSSETSCSCQLNAEQVVDEHPLPTPFA